MTQYALAQKKAPHLNLTVETFVDAIIAQPSIKNKKPEDVTFEDLLGQAYIVTQNGFGGSSQIRVSFLKPNTKPNTDDTTAKS